jgi:hypothetical protein
LRHLQIADCNDARKTVDESIEFSVRNGATTPSSLSAGSPLMSPGSPLLPNGSPYKRRRETEVESQTTHDDDNPFTKRNFERQKIVKQTTGDENEIVRVSSFQIDIKLSK